MGLIFRRSIKILPGLKVNVGKKGTSVTVGARGAHVTYGKGRKTASVGVPGTGVYYRKTISTKEKTSVNAAYSGQQQLPQRTKAENQTWGFVFLAIGIVILLLAFLASLQTIGRIIIGCIGAFTLLFSLAYFNAESSDEPANEISTEKEPMIPNPFALGIGIILILLFGYLFFASFGWSWQEQSKHNIHIVYHFGWLKWIFYPLDIAGIIFGALCAYIGISTDDDKQT